MKVYHFHRRPDVGHFSIESLFANLRSAMQSHGAHVEKMELPWISSGLLPRLKNVCWAARRQADVNHITGDVHYLALGFDRRRTVLTIHDLSILDYYNGIRRTALELLWYDLPIRNAAEITVISEATRQKLLDLYPGVANRVSVIPNAVDPAFRPRPARQRSLQKANILQIGTAPHKNLDRLVPALESLNARLTIVGTLSEGQKDLLQRHCIEYECRRELAFSEIRTLYENADLVTLVSTMEGFGMPIVEAQCVERPVITSNCSSMPEVAGSGACLVDPFDIGSIRTGIKRVLDDQHYRNALVQSGRQNRQRFDLKVVARQYLDVYNRVFSKLR